MVIQLSVSGTFSQVFTGKPRDISSDEYLAESATPHRPVDTAAPIETVPESRKAEYIGDLANVYGLDNSAVLPAGLSRSYGEMAARVLERCGTGAERIDLIILAYGNTEFFVPEGAGSFLADVFPSTKMVYAVTEQGKLAPFTALQLAKCHLYEEDFERAAVVAIEQRAVPLVDDHDASKPDCDAAAAVLASRDIDVASDKMPSVVLRKVGGEARLGQLVRETLSVDTLDCDPLIVIGDRIPRSEVAAISPHVQQAEPGRVCTGVWEMLDRSLRSDGKYSGPVLVVEYDPMLDQLGVASMNSR